MTDDLGRDVGSPRITTQSAVRAYETHFNNQETKVLKAQLVQTMSRDWLWNVARLTTSRELWDAVAERIRREQDMEPPDFIG